MKEIEIPFGARDSELKGWEYTIPEGMEAEIKDGKIVVREKESEDERIRAVILKLVLGMRDEIFTTADKLVTKPKVLAWLKKQKEQKPAEWSEEEKDKLNSIERLIVNANAHGNHLIGDKEAIDLQHFIRSIVKPTTNLVEWNKEDEKMRNSILDKMISLDNAYGGDGIAYGSEIAWLKSLRPSWKPSEEQMEALAMAVTFFKTKWTGAKVKEQLALESLYEDLNKRI